MQILFNAGIATRMGKGRELDWIGAGSTVGLAVRFFWRGGEVCGDSSISCQEIIQSLYKFVEFLLVRFEFDSTAQSFHAFYLFFRHCSDSIATFELEFH